MNGSIAFLIVDMQEQFRALLTGDPRFEHALEHIQYVAGQLRPVGQTVMWVRDIEGVREDRGSASPAQHAHPLGSALE